MYHVIISDLEFHRGGSAANRATMVFFNTLIIDDAKVIYFCPAPLLPARPCHLVVFVATKKLPKEDIS